MRNTICFHCQASVDRCWRWCPECGSLDLSGPADGPAGAVWRDDDYSVEWELECDGLGGFGDQPAVGSPA